MRVAQFDLHCRPMSYGELFSTRLVAEQRFEDAVKQATEEIETDPDEPEAWFNRAQALSGLGRLEEAAHDYGKALGRDASASNMDPAALDDELFDVLKRLALAKKSEPSAAAGYLTRYQDLLPEGRHLSDIPKWLAHLNGEETVWVRDEV